MRMAHSIGGESRCKSLLGSGIQYQTKFTDKQFGDGYKTSKKDDMDQSSDDGEAELPPRTRGYINSPNGRRPKDIFDDDSVAWSENDAGSDTQSEDAESDTESNAGVESKENDYNILDWILEEVEENLSPKEREKEFRKQFAEYIYWVHQFQKQPVYKKVMQTVKELRDGPHDYGMEEASFKAVQDRKYLLNDVLRKMDENSESDDEDGESDTGESTDDEEENDSYRVAKQFPSVYS